jgi:hypothetical protein
MTVNNLRRQSKSMGSCSFNLLAQASFGATAPSTIKEPRPGQRFVVIDAYGLTNLPPVIESFTEAKVIFFGRIRNVAFDKFKDSNDYMGEVSGDQEGWFFFQEPVFNTIDAPFNANTDNFYLANKKSGVEEFEKYVPKKLKDSDVSELVWATADQPYVWSLEEAIKYVGATCNVTFYMPWETDGDRINANNDAIVVPPGETLESQTNYVSNSENKAKYKVFLDKTKPKSFTSLYGKSVVTWLDENLLDNFTYRFDYTSSGFANCHIINKSLIDTDFFPKAVLPLTISVNNRTTNLSVTEIGETYTQVEVVSNRILFAGTLTTKNLATGQRTLDRNWEYVDEKNYAWANDSDIAVFNPSIYRNSYKNQKAFTEFKFIADPNTDCPITVSKPMDFNSEFAERTRTPFFPFIGIKESTGDLTISNSMNSHQTPDTANLSWATTLPYGYSTATSKYHLFEPFVSITVTTEVSPNKKSIVHLHGSAEKPTIDLGDDVKLKFGFPQTLAFIDNTAKLFEIGGVTFEPSTSPTSGAGGSYDWVNGSSETNPNPDTTSLGLFPNFTHWSMIYLTLAGHSAQRISLYKLKDNPGISTRKKVIVAEDCEYWIAHPGSFKPTVTTDGNANSQGYDYVPEVTSQNHKIFRNDYKKQKSYLDMYSAFLFLDKKAITLDYTLDGWTNNYEIGQPIQSVNDKQIITTNSVIESIEYFIEGAVPRIRVSTLIPELPPLKKLGEQIRIEGAAPQLSPMSKYKESSVSTTKEDKRETITTIQGRGGGGIGGGTTITKSHIYNIVGGNTLNWVSSPGIKKVNTEILSSALSIDTALGTPLTLDDGLGWGKSVDNQAFVLILNDSKSYIQYDLQQQPVFASMTTSISGSVLGVPTAWTAYRVVGPI